MEGFCRFRGPSVKHKAKPDFLILIDRFIEHIEWHIDKGHVSAKKHHAIHPP
jgi:hypothetical protein